MRIKIVELDGFNELAFVQELVFEEITWGNSGGNW
jgi:hypothetical protein